MRTILVVAALILLASAPLEAQGGTATSKKKGPTVQDLQQRVIELQVKVEESQAEVTKSQKQVIDLQGQLITCQTAAKANEPNPAKNTLEAFRTFKSTVETGANYQTYKNALIPLKVRVDQLAYDSTTSQMKKLLDRFVDAGTLWGIHISTAGRGVFSYDAGPLLTKYGYVAGKVFSLQQVSGELIQGGLGEIRSLRYDPEAKPGEATSNKDCTPRYYKNGLDNPCPETAPGPTPAK